MRVRLTTTQYFLVNSFSEENDYSRLPDPSETQGKLTPSPVMVGVYVFVMTDFALTAARVQNYPGNQNTVSYQADCELLSIYLARSVF